MNTSCLGVSLNSPFRGLALGFIHFAIRTLYPTFSFMLKKNGFKVIGARTGGALTLQQKRSLT